jgi:hypothetical protein
MEQAYTWQQLLDNQLYRDAVVNQPIVAIPSV